MRMSMTRFWLFCSLMILAMVACADSNTSRGGGAAGSSPVVLGAESPQALVARMQQAARDADLREFAACLTRDFLADTIEDMTLLTAMAVAFSVMDEDLDETEAAAAVEEKLAGLDEILTRYGLPAASDEDAIEGESELETILAGMDHAAMAELLAELVDVLQNLGDDDDSSSEFLPVFEGELTDLTIDGDQATATISDMPIEFTRVDGRWFASMPEGGSEFDTMESNVPGAGAEAATVLGLEASRQDTLDESGQHWYVITAPEDGTVTLTTRSTGENDGDLVIEAYLDENFGEYVVRSDWDLEGDSAHETVTVGLNSGQVLHAKVAQWGFGRDELSYQLDVSHTPGVVEPPQSSPAHFTGSSVGPGSAEVRALAVDESRQGMFDASGDARWYLITAPGPGELTLTTRSTGEDDGDLVLETFVDGDFSDWVAHSDQDLGGDLAHETVTMRLDAGQTVHLKVSQWAGGSDAISYQLTASFSN
jgi:hypothetical protein